MKRLFVLLLIPIGLMAQQPFGYHATWHYTYYEYGYSGFKKIVHVGDTTMHGMTWLTFDVSGISEIRTGPGPNDIIQDTNATFGNIYLATRNDSVFRLLNGIPYLLYDRGANIGDSWQFAPTDTLFGCFGVPEATVTSKGFQNLGGANVPYIDIEMPMDSVDYGGQLVYQPICGQILHERIYPDFGSTSFTQLFEPSPNTCDGTVFKSTSLPIYQLRCFENDSISINLSGQACNYWSLISVEENETISLKIYPNPADEFVRIESNYEIKSIDVLDFTGSVLHAYTTIGQIPLPSTKGIYLLRIEFKNGLVRIEKIIRQ